MAKAEIIGELIGNLLDNRDFLGYQLAHENGCVTKQELDELCQNYKNDLSDDELLEKARVAKELIGDKLDCDNLSVMLRCDVNRAVKIMKTLESIE